MPVLKVLFVCSRNKLRSPTAEQVFADCPGLAVASAGLDHDAEEPVGAELLEWADLVIAMEKVHRKRLQKRFKKHLGHLRLVVVDIPDNYGFMDPDLVDLLEKRCARHLARR